MNNNIFQLLKETSVTPDWPRFEAKVMDAIMTGSVKKRSATQSSFPFLAGLVTCLLLWVFLAVGGLDRTAADRADQTNFNLSVREQNIIKEIPEMKEFLTQAPVVKYSAAEQEKYLKKRYPEYEGGF